MGVLVLDRDITTEDEEPGLEGLLLWKAVPVDLEMDLHEVRSRRCANCGGPAEVAYRTLRRNDRRFLCHGCARPR